MTPKEKAKELVEKFLAKLKTATPKLNRPNYQSKQCALIAVDEILKAVEGKYDEYYWQEVKQEIEKL